MAKKRTIPETVLMAATGMLQAYYPELSPSALIEAIETPKAEPKLKRRLSPRQYAELMGISKDTVIRLIHRGELEHIRIGRQFRILV